jgi:hypothetical protein
MSLFDSSGKLLGKASTGRDNEVSLTTSIPADGVYKVVVTSKPGEVNVTAVHNKAP